MNSTPLRSFVRPRAPRRPGARLAGVLLMLAAALPAQWTSNAKKNTFVDGNCQPPLAGFASIMALDPVLVPCNDGCFYAWVDPNGAIQIQVIDDCGYRALSSPHVVAGTGNHPIGGIALGLPSQLAGCQYIAKNELFLAYTVWNGTREELMGDVFTYAGGTLTPTGAISLFVSTHFHGLLTPCANTSFQTPGVRDGAVWGCRDWDIILGDTEMNVGNVKTALLTMTTAQVDAFVQPGFLAPPRLSVLSDNAEGTYAAWRGWHPINGWYHQGHRTDEFSAAWSVNWPTLEYPTSRTTDDWVLAADLQSGVFFAQAVGANATTIVAGHNDGRGEVFGAWSTGLTVATVTSGASIHTLAMVGISAEPFTGNQRVALAYRANTSVELVELGTNGAVYFGTSGTNPAVLTTVSGTATVRGCGVLSHRGVAVGWTGDIALGTYTKLYGQEVETATWTKLWKNGNKLLVAEDTTLDEQKFVPMVVRKHSLPDVIFGWVDTRVAPPPQSPPLDPPLVPGAYVQSVADDFLQMSGMGFKRVNGKLGSSSQCFEALDHFDLGDIIVSPGNPSDPHDPNGGIGTELFLRNATDSTYDLLKDIHVGAASSTPSASVQLGSLRLFAATDAGTGREPWVTDGTPAGTLQLADCALGAASSSPQFLAAVGNLMLFSASTVSTGRELWRTDGTPAGTAMVLDLLPGSGNGVVSGTDAAIGNYLYFWGNDGVAGIELWRTDGTALGTTLVANLSAGSANTIPGNVATLGSKLLFSGTVSGLGAEPHVLDAVTGTVSLLADLVPGSASSSPGALTRAGSFVFFSANTTAVGRELWRTDGTSPGTQMVADIHPTGSSNPSDFTDGGNMVLFMANDGVHGLELWRTDGTAAGTALVADVLPGVGNGNPDWITPIGEGRFVFAANSSATDREPWITDGTAAGTERIADVNPGPSGSAPRNFDVVAGMLYFTANNGSEQVTVQLELDGPLRFGQGCPGTGGLVPSIGAASSPSLGQTFVVTVTNGAPNSFAVLFFNTTSMPIPIGGCTAYVTLPELGSFLAMTDASGTGAVAITVPNDPILLDLTLYLQWAVIDPAGALFGTFSLSDALRATIR